MYYHIDASSLRPFQCKYVIKRIFFLNTEIFQSGPPIQFNSKFSMIQQLGLHDHMSTVASCSYLIRVESNIVFSCLYQALRSDMCNISYTRKRCRMIYMKTGLQRKHIFRTTISCSNNGSTALRSSSFLHSSN